MNVAAIYKIYSGGLEGTEIFIGGLDATMYATVNDFVTYFREAFNPSNPAVFTLADILEYETEPAGVGLINVRLRVRAPFNVPDSVFSRYDTYNNPSRLTYYIDPEGYSKNVGIRAFANQNTLKNFLIRGVNSFGNQWSRSISIDYLDFEQLLQLDTYLIHDARNGMQRLNLRNASTMGEDPADDTVLTNFNLNNAGKRNVIYLHENMATINNGAPFKTLQQAINRGVEARFISPTNRVIPDVVTDLGIASLGGTFVEFSFTNIPTADFYEVWLTDHSDPNNLINRFFMFAEISNINKSIRNLKKDTQYSVRLKTVDWAYNKSDFSDALTFTTPLYDFSIQATEIEGTYAQIKINDYATLASIYTITSIDVYVDGVFNNNFSSREFVYASGLSIETNYNIEVKINTSEVGVLASNEISVLTTDTFEFSALASGYYPLTTNSNDASGNGRDGTDTSMTYAGGYAKFGTGYIDIADNDAFSFTDGTNDTAAHIAIGFIWNDKTGVQYWISKRKNQTEREWQIHNSSNNLTLYFWNPTTPDAYIGIRVPLTSITTGVLNTIQFAYDGSKLHSGIKAFLNGGTEIGTTVMEGTYTGQVNDTSEVRIGAPTFSTSFNFKGDMKDIGIWKNRTFTEAEIIEIDRRIKNNIPLM